MVSSVLDAVPGVGPARRKALLRKFGSMARMREAEVEELARVIPARVAAAVHAALHAPTRGAGIDLEEGEGG